MEPMTIREILEAVHGSLLGDFGDLNRQVDRVETDSRTIHPGSLFIPLSGERFDGHAYINAALEGGAAGCFTQRERESYLPGKFYIKVDSTHRALRDLAKYYKDRFPVPVVAITGSVGKTTTKDMVAAVLGEKYSVLKTEGNLNNDIGVPLTLLRLKPEHQIAVLELGMNHAGEIDYLSAIVEPDMVLMTNIGDSHIEHFGSREKILQAKSEIFRHAKPGAPAVINGDDPLLNTLPGSLPFPFVRVGTGEDLDYRATDLASDGKSRLSCRLSTPKGSFSVEIPALGEHMVYPTLMAAAVGEHFGLTAEEIDTLEAMVNARVQQDDPIRCWFPAPDELAALPLRKRPTVSEHVRVVAMGDYEMVACGGTHPATTGQIGPVKILSTAPARGKLRLTFVAGMRAVRYFQRVARCAEGLSAALSATADTALDALHHERETAQEARRAAREQLTLAMMETLRRDAISLPCGTLYCGHIAYGEPETLLHAAAALTAQPGAIALLSCPRKDARMLIFARSANGALDMAQLLRESGARGGGKPDMAQGSAPDGAALESAKRILFNK